ncbi:unnamed protein product [Nippostrongylus brasiliensis]|uniref:Ovule protein n=1 Tax=Nippostrongylus brasiliensis TaxID=27835 RepID=A0A0N4XX17_NIPBR|nr:unnamed protein product [Nippostrongylus brasiliensis]
MYDPVILVERLDIDLSKWRGLSMDKLMDPRLLEEKKIVVINYIAKPRENLSRKRRNSEVLEDVHKKKAMVSN